MKYDWKAIQAFYDSGKTAVECCEHFGMASRTISLAVKRGDFVVRSRSKSMSMSHRKRGAHSQETKDKLRDIAVERGFGGRNYRKTFDYNGVVLESSYELKLAQELDAYNIKWIRPKRLAWTDSDGKLRHYTPDFYLPDQDIYLDPKNDYLIKIDADKIDRVQQEHGVRVLVLNKDQLTWSYIAGVA